MKEKHQEQKAKHQERKEKLEQMATEFKQKLSEKKAEIDGVLDSNKKKNVEAADRKKEELVSD